MLHDDYDEGNTVGDVVKTLREDGEDDLADQIKEDEDEDFVELLAEAA